MHKDEAQAFLDEVVADLGIVGAQLALFDGNDMIEVATGTARRDTDTPMTVDTRMQIGSTTKVFTATLVMTYVDEGKLDLDEPVVAYLPSFRTPDADAAATITLRHLLSMSAGIDNGPYSEYGNDDAATARYLEAFSDVANLFAPGTGYGYSNAATTVAGRVVEVVAGGAWDELLRERVLDPLELDRTRSRLEDLMMVPVAHGYHPDAEGTLHPYPAWGLTHALKAAGSTLASTAGDLVRFARIFLDGGVTADGERILSQDAVTTMHTPHVALPARYIADAWGVGPMVKEWDGGRLHGHSGTNTGSSSYLVWSPDHHVAIATIANVPPRQYPMADRIHDEVFARYGVTRPARPTPIDATDVAMDRYAGTFVADGVTYAFDRGPDGQLQMASTSSAGLKSTVVTPLVCIGPDRFVPTVAEASGGRLWDVAFWGDDGHGRATHYLNGVFASRRADG